MTKLYVVQGGSFPGNPEVVDRLKRAAKGKGKPVSDEEAKWRRVEPGDILDARKLDERIVRSLLANGIVTDEEPENGGQGEPEVSAEESAEEVTGDG